MEGLTLGLTQRQEQTLSPQMLQTLGLFQLSTMELTQKIKEEIEQNPALEIPEDDEPAIPMKDEGLNPIEREEEDKDSWDYENSFEDLNSNFSDGPDAYLENAIAQGQSLRDHLIDQLRLSRIDSDDFDLAMLVIGDLDDNGFFIEAPESLVENIDSDRLSHVIELIQSFDPMGICVYDYKASLILQARLKRLGEDDLEVFTSLIQDHFEELKNPNFPRLAKSLGTTEETAVFLYDFLKTLNPFPGGSYGSEVSRSIVPEFSIKKQNGALVIEMNRNSLPPLSLAEGFEDLASGLTGEQAKEASTYVSDCVRKAKTLIDQVKLRYNTLYKVGLSLIDHQRDFFFKGPHFLKPLTQKVVASDVGVHETTISRISQEKWILTDWGLYQIKQFFSQGVVDDQGQGVARSVVKDRIAQILKDPDLKGLSDQKLADMLTKEGLKISRRTVNKYRLELNIDSSYER